MRNARSLYPIFFFVALILMFLAPLYNSLSLSNVIYSLILSVSGAVSFFFITRDKKAISIWVIAPLVAALFFTFSVPLVQNDFPVVSITATGQKNPESISSEVFVQFVTNPKSHISVSYPGWEKRPGVYVSYQNQPNTITFSGQWSNDSHLSLTSHAYSGVAKLKIGNDEREIDLYSSNAHTINIPLPDGAVSWKSWLQRVSIFISLSLLFFALTTPGSGRQSEIAKLLALCLVVTGASLWYVKDISYTGDLELVVLSGNGSPSKMSFDAGYGFTKALTFPVKTGSVHTEHYPNSSSSEWHLEVSDGSFSRFQIDGEVIKTEQVCDFSKESEGCVYQIFGDSPHIWLTDGRIKYQLENVEPDKNTDKYFVYISKNKDVLTATSSRAVIYASAWDRFSQWVNSVSVTDNNNSEFSTLIRISALKPSFYKTLGVNEKGEGVKLTSFNYPDFGSFIAMKVAFVLVSISFVFLAYFLFAIMRCLISSAINAQSKKIWIVSFGIFGWLLIAMVIGWPAVLGWDGFSPYIQAQAGQITLWYGIGYPLIVGGFLLSNMPQVITVWSFLATSVVLLGSCSLFFRYYQGKLACWGVIWAIVYIPLTVIMLGMLTHLRDAFNGLTLALFMLGSFCLAIYWRKLSLNAKLFFTVTLFVLGIALALLRIDNVPSLIFIAIGLSLLTFKPSVKLFSVLLLIAMSWGAINKVVEPLVYPDRHRAEEEKRLYASTAVMNPLTGMLVYGKGKLDPQLYKDIYVSLNKIMDVEYALKNWSPYNVVYWHQTASERPLPTSEVSKQLTKLYFISAIKEPVLFLHLRLSSFTAILGKDIFPLPPIASPQFNILPGLSDHLLSTTNPWKQTVELMGFGPHPHLSANLMKSLMKWSDYISSNYLQILMCFMAIVFFKRAPFAAVIACAELIRATVFLFFAPASVFLYLYELQLIGFMLPMLILIESKVRKYKGVGNDC